MQTSSRKFLNFQTYSVLSLAVLHAETLAIGSADNTIRLGYFL